MGPVATLQDNVPKLYQLKNGWGKASTFLTISFYVKFLADISDNFYKIISPFFYFLFLWELYSL